MLTRKVPIDSSLRKQPNGASATSEEVGHRAGLSAHEAADGPADPQADLDQSKQRTKGRQDDDEPRIGALVSELLKHARVDGAKDADDQEGADKREVEQQLLQGLPRSCSVIREKNWSSSILAAPPSIRWPTLAMRPPTWTSAL